MHGVAGSMMLFLSRQKDVKSATLKQLVIFQVVDLW